MKTGSVLILQWGSDEERICPCITVRVWWRQDVLTLQWGSDEERICPYISEGLMRTGSVLTLQWGSDEDRICPTYHMLLRHLHCPCWRESRCFSPWWQTNPNFRQTCNWWTLQQIPGLDSRQNPAVSGPAWQIASPLWMACSASEINKHQNSELRNLFIQPLDYRFSTNINQIIIMFKIGVWETSVKTKTKVAGTDAT